MHPLYLDRMSSQYARRIETSEKLDQTTSLIGDMIRAYCRLVHTHAGQQYASAVQKTLAYIDANLSGDLSLPHIASVVGVSSGYLSTLFHRETGYTLAEYINSQRMKAAQQLLRSTRLQVQTIAQHCGISDVNYFSRLFKKHTGLTPREYRLRQRETILN